MTVYGGEVTGTQGQISSPFYPGTYSANADYSWTVTVPLDMYIQFSFVAMDIETTVTGDCLHDWLIVSKLY